VNVTVVKGSVKQGMSSASLPHIVVDESPKKGKLRVFLGNEKKTCPICNKDLKNGEIFVPFWTPIVEDNINGPCEVGADWVHHHLDCLIRDVGIDDAELFEKIQRAVWRKDMLDEV
jgi:hypothetical protein